MNILEKKISTFLQKEISTNGDDNFGFITITSVEFKREAKDLHIYISNFPQNENIIAYLVSRKKFLKHNILKLTNFKKINDLLFHFDKSGEIASKIAEMK